MTPQQSDKLKTYKSKYHMKYILIPALKRLSISSPFVSEDIISASGNLIKWSRLNGDRI